MPRTKYRSHRKKVADETIENVRNRLCGRSLRDFPKDAGQRKGRWYREWSEMASFLETNPPPSAILRYGYRLVEMCSGHGYTRIARASEEMLELVIYDKKLK